MDDLSIGYEWAKTHSFDEVELHFCTIMALNILDGVSNNDYDSKNILMSVYDGISDKNPSPFDKKIHQIIDLARSKDPIIPKTEYEDVITNLRVSLTKDLDNNSYERFEQFIWENIS